MRTHLCSASLDARDLGDLTFRVGGGLLDPHPASNAAGHMPGRAAGHVNGHAAGHVTSVRAGHVTGHAAGHVKGPVGLTSARSDGFLEAQLVTAGEATSHAADGWEVEQPRVEGWHAPPL